MDSFFLFLIQCTKLVRSAFYTFADILFLFFESLFILFDFLFLNASIFTFDLSKQDLNVFDDDNYSADNDFFGPQRGGSKFMNKYTVKDIQNIIKYSIIGSRLKEVGFSDWYIEFDLTDSFHHYLYLRLKRYPEAEKYIGFLIIRIDQRHNLKATCHSPQMIQFIQNNIDMPSLNLLNIKWLSLQNPGATFTTQRPRLPGQKYPGSGIGKSFFIILRRLCILNRKDGIMNIPEHFHCAVLYEGFVFVDPFIQGSFERMKCDLKNDIQKYGLSKVSWAIGVGAMKLGGEPYKWNPGEQVFPLSKRTFAYFNSCAFAEIVDDAIRTLPKFEIDWNSTCLAENSL